jgi:hypothetical protein
MFRRVWTGGAAVLLLASAAGCTPGASSEVDDVPPEVRFDNLRFEVYRGPLLEAAGTAFSASMRRDSGAIAAERIQVDFPAAPGREAARLYATRGKGSATARWFQAEGGVTLVQGTDRVDTERARFDGQDRLLRGDAPVVLHGDGYALEGPGFTLDPEAGTVRIDGGAELRTGRGPGENAANPAARPAGGPAR